MYLKLATLKTINSAENSENKFIKSLCISIEADLLFIYFSWLFNRGFVYNMSHKMHNILLHFSVAVKILYSLLSAAEVEEGIIKQPNPYVWRVFWILSSWEC